MVMGIVDGCVLRELLLRRRGFFFPKENFCKGMQAKLYEYEKFRGNGLVKSVTEAWV